MRERSFVNLARFATVLALAVVVLGAYVRLSDAGLGCPDWPGCYGRLGVPSSEQAVALANDRYPDRPLEAPKAWKEMVHRYFAGILGLIVFTLAWVAWRRRHARGQQVGVPVFLAALIVFQALLGMWTVTLLLKPVVVMAHLLGGLATLSLLAWLALRQSGQWSGARPSDPGLRRLRPFALIGLLVLVVQIALGGWTSANYAALHCPDFPTCQGQWWPDMDFQEGFTLWRGLGVDYEGGVLHNEARVAIHVMHRLGAVVVFLYLGWLAFKTMALKAGRTVRGIGIVLLAALLAQVSLGIANVLLSLPLPVAVAHNAGGALLLLILVTLNHALRPREVA